MSEYRVLDSLGHSGSVRGFRHEALQTFELPDPLLLQKPTLEEEQEFEARYEMIPIHAHEPLVPVMGFFP